MKFFIFILLLLVPNIFFAQTPFVCKGQYYLSLSDNIDSESGLYEVVISPDGSILFETVSDRIGATMNAIGYRSTDNFIYGVNPFTFHLYRLGSDGKAVDLGIPNGIPTSFNYYTGDVTPDGKYLLLIGSSFTSNIVKVDLEDSDFSVTIKEFSGREIYDIAFDPFTSDLYGFSGVDSKLKKIDPETGEIISDFASQSIVSHIGALFFDTFGTLFGYGSVGSGAQNTLIEFDIKTGSAKVVGKGPDSQGNDGCSCPYSISMLKTVSTPIALPCTTIEYDFIISNNSGITRNGIRFSDEMPSDFSIIGVINNPYGGDVNIFGNTISIENMNVLAGVDTITILVEIGENALGFYQNQAVLGDLPSFLGESTVSDDPTTVQFGDSTSIEIIPFDIDFIDRYQRICKNELLTIDASIYGVTYEWDDGSTKSTHDFSEAGMYSVTVSSTCEQKIVNIEIDTIGATVDILESVVQIELGDQVQFHSKVSPDDIEYTIDWTNDNQNSLSCIDCLNPFARPFFDTSYQIVITDEFGCTTFDRVVVEVIKDRELYVPNIFTPNNDGINDWFSIFTKNGNAFVNLTIFDRWGNKVFHKENIDDNVLSEGWDGTFNGNPVQSGIYTWVATVTFLDGFVLLKAGDITVIY